MATAAPATRPPTERERNIARTLRILRGVCGARITPTQIGYRENWSARSVLNYLRELERDGHAEVFQRNAGKETVWRITQAGKDHLQRVTAESIGANLEPHPATLGRDQ